jgi:hypothetical protein
MPEIGGDDGGQGGGLVEAEEGLHKIPAGNGGDNGRGKRGAWIHNRIPFHIEINEKALCRLWTYIALQSHHERTIPPGKVFLAKNDPSGYSKPVVQRKLLCMVLTSPAQAHGSWRSHVLPHFFVVEDIIPHMGYDVKSKPGIL